MNIFQILLIVNIIFKICYSEKDINSNLTKFSDKNIEYISNYEDKNSFYFNKKTRKLENENDSFTKIRIYIDKTYINKNIVNSETLNIVLNSLEKCVKSIEELIKVKRLDKIQFTESEISKLGLNSSDINPNLLQTGTGIYADLIIFPKFIDFPSSSQMTLAIGKPLIFEPLTNRPIGAILSINKNLPTIPNSQSYLESVLIHQITHILGFIYEIFDKFQIGLSNVIKTDIEPRTYKTKKFIISPKVVEYAKKYFNCPNITGVELEDLGGYDNYNHSHWEARILLGEYMNSEVYTPEQAISIFTLALLEDSGWYRTNLYTGGLMRFGKYQGCAFLNEDCEVKNISKNKFKNDLFPLSALTDLYKTTCSSGRQSRCYVITHDKTIRNYHISGKEIADYCFVSDCYPKEEEISYYVGSCNRGNGEYGQKVLYNEYFRKNIDIPENFGEKMSNNSFCVLSSAVPLSLKEENLHEFNVYNGITHPMCYPMFCTSKSLTIEIYGQYIVCPREGGIVEIKGNYKGYIYCPDYNLICTGTIMCNDMFDCIEKHSLEKNDSLDYDYEIKTTQEKIKENALTEENILIGYELSNEDIGKCPQHCSQCKKNRKCFICKENYILVGSKEGDNNPIYCMQNKDLGQYYKNEDENTYYLCSDNCLSCSAKDQCNNCDSMYKLNNNNSACEEIIPNCNILDNNKEKCEECKDNFYLLNDDKYHCYNDSLDKEKYFTEDEGITFVSCSKVLPNCEKCQERNICLKCKDGYIYNENNSSCVPEISSCKKYDINYENCEECEEGYYLLNYDKIHCYNDSLDKDKYITEDGGITYISCDKLIDNCEKCNERNKCNQCQKGFKLYLDNSKCDEIIPFCEKYDSNYQLCVECKEGYYLLNNDKLNCHNNSLDKDKYFTEDEGKTYLSCENIINNCDKCKERNKCLLCKKGYKFDFESSSCIEIISFCKYYDSGYEKCDECKEGFYLLNSDNLNCYNISLEPDKYFTEDGGKKYFSCEKIINYCEKCKERNECLLCKNGYIYNDNNISCVPEISSCKKYDINYENCEECEEGYYLLNYDKIHCYNDSLDKDKYITEDGGITYISCDKLIDNCEKCNERNKCNQCQKSYELVDNGKKCQFFFINKECNINIHYLENEELNFLNEDNIKNLVKNYANTYNHDLGQVEHYINKKNNFTITIYILDNCTKDLLNIGAYSLNTSDIFEHYSGEYLIICFITFNYKNNINFFENMKKVDLENFYAPKLLKYNLENNYTNLLNNYYSPLLIEKILEYNIDIFSMNNEYLDNKCNSFDIGGIDIPVHLREKIIFNFHGKQEFICTDMNCEITSYDAQKSLSNCICNINSDFNYLFSESEKINLTENAFSFETKFHIMDYITCTLKNYDSEKIIENFFFYFSILCLIIEIMCFIIFVSYKQIINIQKYIKPNPQTSYPQETLENKNMLNTEENPKHSSSDRNSIGNPPKKVFIKYKYKWLNKPKILNLNNSHDEDLEIQSRDEANIENEMKRKIKIYPFFDNNSSMDSSYLDDSLFDTCDKRTEKSNKDININKKTIPVGEEKLKIKNNNGHHINTLPQIISREQNARRKIKIHSIKNNEIKKENIITPDNNKENKIKKFSEIYFDIICIKQHLINLFICPKKREKESFIPISMKITRFLFLLILNLFLNSILLNQNYLEKKYNYFNIKYDLSHKAEKNFKISTSEKIKYSIDNCVINILISFIICLIVQLIIGIIFFNTKKKVENLIEFNKIMEIKKDNAVLRKIKCLFILFFFINFVLIIFFCLFLIGFNIINNNSEIDFLFPSLINFIVLQIIPFLISFIIAIIMYFGLKRNNKKMINWAQVFLF